MTAVSSPLPTPFTFPKRLNLSPLLEKSIQCEDKTSNLVARVVHSYHEIETLPKQVAVHFTMSTLLHWQVLQDEQSYAQMPEWLRPEPCQIETEHAAWIDRIPWPAARRYLVSHPELTLDDFAAVYSSSFSIRWNYDPSFVVIQAGGPEEAYINPIYEEHIRQLKNWNVGDAVRKRFPELAEAIDSHREP